MITGFTSAAAINIASSQFKSLLGIPGKTESFLDSLIVIFKNLNQIRYQDTLLGIGTIIVLVLLKVNFINFLQISLKFLGNVLFY